MEADAALPLPLVPLRDGDEALPHVPRAADELKELVAVEAGEMDGETIKEKTAELTTAAQKIGEALRAASDAEGGEKKQGEEPAPDAEFKEKKGDEKKADDKKADEKK